MTNNQVLRWIDTQGWIVVSGKSGKYSEVRSQVLERALAIGSVAYISLAKDGGDALLEDMESLGAPTGYMIDLKNESVESLEERLKDVSVIVIESGENVDELFSLLRDGVLLSLQNALQKGTILLLENDAGILFGQHYITESGHLAQGLGWIEPAIFIPTLDDIDGTELAKFILMNNPTMIAIEVGHDSAIAFGPEGIVEPWGLKSVKIALGSQAQSDNDE